MFNLLGRQMSAKRASGTFKIPISSCCHRWQSAAEIASRGRRSNEKIIDIQFRNRAKKGNDSVGPEAHRVPGSAVHNCVSTFATGKTGTHFSEQKPPDGPFIDWTISREADSRFNFPSLCFPLRCIQLPSACKMNNNAGQKMKRIMLDLFFFS